jgi:hypothetical protein
VPVLAFAEELCADPALFGAFTAAVGDQDDVTLVVAADPASVAPFEEVALSAGLDAPGSADVLLVPCRGPWEAALLGRNVAALYSSLTPLRPLRRLPRFDGGNLDVLRGLTARGRAEAA